MVLSAPVVHQRSSSLPNAFAAPVPPLKVHKTKKIGTQELLTPKSADVLYFNEDQKSLKSPISYPRRHDEHTYRHDHENPPDSYRQRVDTWLSVQATIDGPEMSSPVSPGKFNTPPPRPQRDDISLLSPQTTLEASPPALEFSSSSSDISLDDVHLTQLVNRHNCIRELYYSERQFCRELSAMVKIYNMYGERLGISESKLAQLFSNISHVLDISIGFLSILEAHIPVNILTSRYAIDEREQKNNLGKAMRLFLNSSMYKVFEIYTRYNKRQLKVYGKLLRDPSSIVSEGTLNEYLFEASYGSTKLPFHSLLIKPTQRLGQYPIYLKSILQNTPSEHPDHDDLRAAYTRACSYCEWINARLEC